MTAAALDLRGLPDEDLLSLYRSDERAAAAALAEAGRRDRIDRAAAQRAQLRAEWYDAAYQQYLAAEDVCRGNLLSREGLAAGIADPFSLWHGRADVAERYASEELNDFWAKSPRVTVGQYIAQRAAAMRAAREDISTGEAADSDVQSDTDGPGGLDTDGPGGVLERHSTGADESVRPDRGARETSTGPTTRPIQQRGDRRMSVMEAGRVADRVAEHMTAGRVAADERLRQARGAVACRTGQAPARPPAEPVDGAKWLNIADVWMGKHVHMSDAARHACVLYVAAQHFRLADESRRLAWPKFGRIMLVASEPGCGKTTTMALMGYLCGPEYFHGIDSNPTARGLGHSINQEHSALFVDELHRLVGPRGVRKQDVLTILCSGYEKNGSTVDGRGGRANRISTYAPAVLAGKDILLTSAAEEIGDLIDRCAAVIRMEKPPEDVDLVEVTDDTEADGKRLAEKLAQWAAQEMADTGRFREAFMVACDAAKEDGLRGRAKDIWVPLLATAWLAGPVFLDAARDAAVEFQLRRPVQREAAAENVPDPLADLEARLTDGAELPAWG